MLNDKVECAKMFAAMLHADKGQRYDGEPYVIHLQNVVEVLLRFDHIDKNILAAGYLHDSIEDTQVELTVLNCLFGKTVVDLVWAVSDEPGANRKERKAKTYPKIKSIPGATVIKLADRIANVEHSIRTGNARMQKMYKKEYDDFSANLRVLGENENMWGHLQALHLKCG